MRLREDCEALESLPLRLLIVAVVAAMSVAPAASALEALQDRDFVSRARLAMDRVVNVAQMLSMQGPGAARTVDVDISSEGSLRALRLSVGDRPGGAYASAVVLELSSGGRLVSIAGDPPVRMCSGSLEGLEVTAERFSLRMEASLVGGVSMVVVDVV
jgi:hypothetical protein